MARGDWEFNIGCDEHCAQSDDCDDVLATVFQPESLRTACSPGQNRYSRAGQLPLTTCPIRTIFAEQVYHVTVQAKGRHFNGGAGAAFIVPK
ncbi:MAG: hypothetical protein R2788_11085 [Saprospiraceae bacterium]